MTQPGRLRRSYLVYLLAVFVLAPLRSQTSSASINGTLRDSSGAVMPDAEIVLKNLDTGVERRTLSNGVGNYVLLNIPPGSYSLQASKAGFRTARADRLVLEVNQTATFNLTLEVGAVEQTVSVEAQGAAIQSSTAELGNVIAEREVVDLPLNGRNFSQLLSLNPGVAPVNVSQSSGGFTTAAVGEFTYPSINGQTNRSNFFSLDGIYNTGVILNTPAVDPIIDTIQEFKVQSHNDEAEFGQANGGIVNVVTKGGTNSIRGSAWEFLRNNEFDARNFFKSSVTPYRQNQFGGTVGGPVIKNKVFYFLAYQGFRFRQPAEGYFRVPTEANLRGDLSDIKEPIYNPFTTRPDPARPGNYIREPFAGNQIPASLLNQGNVKYAQTTLPKPVYTGLADRNAIDTSPIRRNQEEFSARGDYNIRQSDTVFFRWNQVIQDTDSGGGRPALSSLGEFRAKNWGASWVHTFGPSSVLQVQFGHIETHPGSYTRFRSEFVKDPKAFAKEVGFADRFCCVFFSPGGVLVPALNVDGFFSGGEGGAVLETHTYLWQYKASYSKIIGSHTLKFGGELDGEPKFLGAPANSSSTYSTFQTANPQSPAGTGSALASFLLDVPGSAGFRNRQTTHRWGGVMGFYAQDSWKISPRITVNFGLRYDRTFVPPLGRDDDPGGNIYTGAYDFASGIYYIQKMAPPCEQAGKPPCIPGGKLPEHVQVEPRGKIYHDYTDNWQPRIGIAYRASNKTAVRGSFGIFFDSWSGVVQAAQNYSAQWPSVGEILGNNLNNPTPSQLTPNISGHDPLPSAAFPAPTPFSQVQWYMDPHYRNAYSMQWNFGVQHELSEDMVVSANYVGSGTRRTGVGGYYNTAVTPGPGEIAPRQPYPYATPTYYDRSIGKSTYNAFQFSFDKKYKAGLAYTVSYTWSKNISLACDGWFGVEGCSSQDPYHLQRDRSVAANDLPHVLSANWVYELPIGKGKQLSTGNNVADYIVGNWQFNGIARFYSGRPYTVGIGGDIANTGNNNCCDGFYERLNLVGDPHLSNPAPERWFNTTSFAAPAPFTFGNSGRNILRTDSAQNFDLSVFRSFPLPKREGMRLTFRAEAFNAFNHPVFGRPGNNLSNPNFGRVLSTANRERILQLGLKLLF